MVVSSGQFCVQREVHATASMIIFFMLRFCSFAGCASSFFGDGGGAFRLFHDLNGSCLFECGFHFFAIFPTCYVHINNVLSV